MTDSQRRIAIVLGIAAVLAVAVVAVWRGLSRPVAGASDGGSDVYYNGPRRAKWNPNVWVDANGKVVPPPPDARPIPASDPRLAGGQPN